MISKPWKGFALILTVILITGGVNAFVVIGLHYLLMPLVPTFALINKSMTLYFLHYPIHLAYYNSLQFLSFAIPLLLITVYFFPVIRYYIFGKATLTEKLQKRFLHSPIVMAFFGSTGWFVGVGSTVYFVNIGGVFMTFRDWITLISSTMTFAAFTLVYVYYSLEFIMSKFYIDDFFPDNRISHIKSTLRLSIRLRFFMLFFSSGVVPFFVYTAIYASTETDNTKLGVFGILSFGILFLGLDIFGIVAQFFHRQLTSMADTTRLIRMNHFHTSLKVKSGDELGYLAESINEMSASLEEKERIYETFGRVVDPEVRDHLLHGKVDPDGEIREVTVLFTDIRGFTSLSEKLSPIEIVNLLNRYFEVLSSTIRKNGGMVNKFIGDAIMGVFNAPLDNMDHRQSALQASREILDAIKKLNTSLRSEGQPEIRIGVGIHTGPVVAGTIGSRERQEYTVIGDTVNVAARLEGLTKNYDTSVLFTGEVIAGNSMGTRSLGQVTVRGKEETLEIFTLN